MTARWVIALSALALAWPATARVIAVTPGGDVHDKLQTALIDAKAGDTVQLAAGRYAFTDGLTLDAPGVTVRGAGQGKTILSFAGQKTAAEGILVTGSNTLLAGFTVEDAKGDGIKAKGVDQISFTDLEVIWTGGPKATNGGYGVYPVTSRNVLIQRVTVRGASDAGIYVGQSNHIVVRDCLVEYNVAGIEIENSMNADVHDNVARKNAGGILVFDLPNLPQMGGHSTRVFANRIVDNDTPNFASKGNTVAEVPTGTGVMVMANRDVHVFNNEIANNGTAAVMIVAYKKSFASPGYNPLPRDVVVRDNRISNVGGAPSFPGGAELAAAVGGRLPPVVWDGVSTYSSGGVSRTEPVRLRVTGAKVLNLNLASATDDTSKARPTVVDVASAGIGAEPVAVALPSSQPGAR